VPVFAVPGVSVVLPSQRGDVRFTPLFLDRRQLKEAMSAVQHLIISQVGPPSFALIVDPVLWCS
jgi:hypothetical protein